MAVDLPDDILHLLCVDLSEQQDFDTLFACATSSRRLDIPALTGLYRAQNVAPVKGGGSEALPIGVQKLVIQKWSILWRSIILSSLGKTLFPYCKYIKVLDLRDLTALLDEEMFRGHIMTAFFADDLARFFVVSQTPTKTTIRGRPQSLALSNNTRLQIVNAIGDALTSETPAVEQITGPILSDALVRWILRLPRLRSLQLWEGNAIDDERLANLVTVHCPDFDDLSIFRMEGAATDRKLARFISGLREQRLKSFEIISGTGIGAESFLALTSHCHSLRELKLLLPTHALPHLGLLKECASLEMLDLEDGNGRVDLEKSQNDVFLEMIVWLRECHKLRQVIFTKFLAAAAIMTQVLPDHNIRLEQLKLDSYVVKDHKAFHQSLTHQTTLTSLFLEGSSDGIIFDDRSAFVESFGRLKELRDVKLVFRSEDVDLISDDQVGALAAQLPNLEEFYVSGSGVTDKALEEVKKLSHLRAMNFLAVTTFTTDGLLDYISNLGPGNHGLSLVIDNADPDTGLTEGQQEQVRAALMEKVEGRFEYQLLRDLDGPEYSDDSD